MEMGYFRNITPCKSPGVKSRQRAAIPAGKTLGVEGMEQTTSS